MSEYTAPAYTILERQNEGLRRITTVIMDGEVMDFEAPRSMIVAAAELEEAFQEDDE